MMGSYFKPLRRKFGLVTLVMACAFMAGWVRSQLICDTSVIYTHLDETGRCPRATLVYLFTVPDCIVWRRNTQINETASVDDWKIHLTAQPSWRTWNLTPEFQSWVSEIPWWRYGFAIGERRHQEGNLDNQNCYFAGPFWSIVIPLTLLSAWLLLSKPRINPQSPPSPDAHQSVEPLN
jgi:hypothetical protein